jgi:hypothetical protein
MQFSLLAAVPPQLAPLSSEPVEVCDAVGAGEAVQAPANNDRAMTPQRATFTNFIFENSLV